jgi:hypothetical protein
MSDFKLKMGVNNCTNNEYHGDKNFLSSSNLKLLLTDVEKFKHEILDGNRENIQKNAFDEGNYAHSLILEPQNIPEEYAFFDGFRKAGAVWKTFKEDNQGKIILSKPQKHRVEQWVKAYEQRSCAKNLISGGLPEHSIAGIIDGVNIKVRADYINIDKGYIADVKTTSYGSDVDSFKMVIENLKYDLSAALYCKLFSQFYGKPFKFYFIVLGKKDKMCEVYLASQDTMVKGNIMVKKALDIYKQCKETGIWTNKDKSDNIVLDEDYEILEV